jgi:hypothetical protein
MVADLRLEADEIQATGQQFAAALSARDFDRLQAIFQPAVRSRLLIPSGLVTPPDARGLMENYQQWFGEATFFEVQRTIINGIGGRLSIFYQILLQDADGWSVLEQHTYSTLENGQIGRFDLLCSGFQPVPALKGG